MLAKSLIGLICLAGLVLAQEEALGPNGQPKPEPYSFSYSADATGKFEPLIKNTSNSEQLTPLTDTIALLDRSI